MMQSGKLKTNHPSEEVRPSEDDTEKVIELQAQVATLEELLQLYEQSAIEHEQRLQGALQKLQEHAHQLEHAQATLQTLQTILDSMGDAVVVVDRAGQPIFRNPAARRLLNGESLDHYHHWTKTCEIFEVDGVSVYPIEELPLARAIRGEDIESAQMRVVRKNTRQSQWLSVNARPLKSEGQLTGAVAVFRDISQSKQFEQDLQQSNKASQEQAQLIKQTLQQLKQTQAQLIQSEKMSSLGQTVAGIAHEINNPVSFIHGNLQPTRKAFQDLLDLIGHFQTAYPDPTSEIVNAVEDVDLPFLSEDVPRMLTSMQAGTERIRDIVKSLRVFSHLDEAEVKAVDIHKGIDSALLILQAHLTRPGQIAAIQVNKTYGDLPLIECHPKQLNEVFVNLLTNAVDELMDHATQCTALPPGTLSPAITIRTKILGDYVIVQILDNGIGIPEKIKSKIFDPFFTTKPVGQGQD